MMELLILTDVSRIFYSEVLRISDFYKSFFNSQSLLSFNTFLCVSLRLSQRNDKAEDKNMPSKNSTPFFNKMVMQFQRIYPLDFRYWNCLLLKQILVRQQINFSFPVVSVQCSGLHWFCFWWRQASLVQPPALHWPCLEPDASAPPRSKPRRTWRCLKPRSTDPLLHMTWMPPDLAGILDPGEKDTHAVTSCFQIQNALIISQAVSKYPENDNIKFILNYG